MIPEPKPDVDDVETYDKYLNAEFIVNRADGDAIKARVRKRMRTDTGELVGREHTNPLFDTRAYECVLDEYHRLIHRQHHCRELIFPM
jgi:hypothetical protein